MSIYLGNQLLSGVATNTISNAHSLFDFMWSDHIKNEMSWLRADTFSWQSGAVYIAAYNHLVADWDNYWTGKDPTNPSDWENETIGSYLITYITAPDGHKIVYPNQETIVQNIYNESGVAWYYILDKENQRFKLPRENPAREVLGQSAPIMYGDIIKYHELTQNDYLDAKGKEAVLIARSFTSSEAFVGYGDSTQTYTGPSLLTDLTQETGVYKGKQYLYFYVGEYSQSQAEQVATLDVQMFLNKADIDLNNLSASGIAKFTAKLDADKIQQVSTLPVSPVAGTLYLIPE